MSRNTATCLVQFAQPSGVEMNAYLVLDRPPTRQDQKRKTLSQYVQKHPTGWKKRLELADLLLSLGSWERAEKQYCQVLKQQPHLEGVWLKLGKLLQLMGREAEAIAVYKHVLNSTENAASQHHLMGAIASCRQLLQTAVRAFESAAAMEPDNASHWLALGVTHLNREVPGEALRAFDKVLHIHPDDIVALNYSYDALVALGQMRAAVQRLDRALELAPKDFRTLKRAIERRCSQRLVWAKEGTQTRQMTRSLLKLAPNAADAYKAIAHYHLIRGEWTNGITVTQRFAEQHPHNPCGWYNYAWSLWYAGYSHAATEAILQADRLYPRDLAIYRALCEMLPAGGKLAEARSIVEKMLAGFPDRWSVWVMAGRLLVERFREVERGCSLARRAPQLQPRLADAWLGCGRVLALAGRHLEAVEALEQGWILLPKEGRSPSAAVWLGESYRLLGKEAASRSWYAEACQLAERLRSFNPATADYWLGRALEGLGEEREALAVYRNALSQQLLYPTRGEVEEALKRLETR